MGMPGVTPNFIIGGTLNPIRKRDITDYRIPINQ